MSYFLIQGRGFVEYILVHSIYPYPLHDLSGDLLFVEVTTIYLQLSSKARISCQWFRDVRKGHVLMSMTKHVLQGIKDRTSFIKTSL